MPAETKQEKIARLERELKEASKEDLEDKKIQELEEKLAKKRPTKAAKILNVAEKIGKRLGF